MNSTLHSDSRHLDKSLMNSLPSSHASNDKQAPYPVKRLSQGASENQSSRTPFSLTCSLDSSMTPNQYIEVQGSDQPALLGSVVPSLNVYQGTGNNHVSLIDPTVTRSTHVSNPYMQVSTDLSAVTDNAAQPGLRWNRMTPTGNACAQGYPSALHQPRAANNIISDSMYETALNPDHLNGYELMVINRSGSRPGESIDVADSLHVVPVLNMVPKDNGGSSQSPEYFFTGHPNQSHDLSVQETST